MKTVFKYLFYLVVIAVLYIVISALYAGKMNGEATIDDAVAQMTSGVDKMVSDGINVVKQ